MSFLRTHRRQLLLLAVFAASALCVLYLAAGLFAASTQLPCRSCHVALTDSGGPDAAHAGVDCMQCHAPTRIEGLATLAVTTPAMLGTQLGWIESDRGRALAPDLACLSCHDLKDLVPADFETVYFDHEACMASDIGCSECHRFDHGHPSSIRRMPMEDCVMCHRSQSAPTECSTCHTERSQGERFANGPWQVTHGVNWRNTHGAGSLDWCSVCHDPTYCSRCHGVALPHPASFGRTHGATAVEVGLSSCGTCHDQQEFCDACHGIEMPHAAGFLQEHSAIATGMADADCLGCHQGDDCESCHVRHTHPGATDGWLGGLEGVIAR